MSEYKKQQNFHLIIAAAGRGTRFSDTLPKQYFKINDKTILRHTIDNALFWPGLKSLHVIINPDDAKHYHEAVMNLDLPNPIHGGKERSDSINNALNNISNIANDEIILIHDAARPFVSFTDIQKLLQSLQNNRAASLAHPVFDTLRHAKDSIAGDIIDRNGLWALQTPQAFRYADIKAAHMKSQYNQEYTDDTSLVSAIGIDVALVEGKRSNIKITTQDDIKMAKALLTKQTQTQVGLGFDVHAFDKEKTDKPLILCGIKVDHTHSLDGHSDADVGLHAITDALFGALAEGDIGQHFPPSDNQYKDMDSAVFLQKASSILKEKNGDIQNIDLTLICELPKIAPYSKSMKKRIAQILDIEQTNINIKATTTEKLGFTGRGEGIAAQAVVTIKIQVS